MPQRPFPDIFHITPRGIWDKETLPLVDTFIGLIILSQPVWIFLLLLLHLPPPPLLLIHLSLILLLIFHVIIIITISIKVIMIVIVVAGIVWTSGAHYRGSWSHRSNGTWSDRFAWHGLEHTHTHTRSHEHSFLTLDTFNAGRTRYDTAKSPDPMVCGIIHTNQGI